jgi:hypothetical protein
LENKIGKKKSLDGLFLASEGAIPVRFPAKFWFLRKVEFNAIETLNNNTKIKPRGVLIESTETAFTEIDY